MSGRTLPPGGCAGCGKVGCDCPTSVWLGPADDEPPVRKLRNFGWDAPKLSDLSLDELNELRLSVTNDPASRNPDHLAGKSIYIHSKSARRKLDALAWAVTIKLNEKRAAASLPTPVEPEEETRA
jgi:hypothetical protein